ncbi:acetylornithine aminotransferase [Ceratocystis pirilliformis]|uniref:acetylornithine transaminase n=1 Tax=Ceratocystis pirilliformis TaxID=259994 RepID=A0ABR3YFQ3_9PEZI
MALRIAMRRQFPARMPSLTRAASTATATATTTATAVSHPDPMDGTESASIVSTSQPFMVATYSRPAPVFVRGSGSMLYDAEDRAYLDLTGGIAVNSLGHCDPEFTRILADQAGQLIHASNLYYNQWTGALSKALVEHTKASGGMHSASAVFVCNSGSEANEAALKFARKVGKVVDPSGAKHEIVSFHQAFHGRTMGALSATPNPKYQKPFSPMVPGHVYGTYNDVAAIDSLVTKNTCGVIVEPIQGEGGVNEGSVEFLSALAARCRAVGAVLIYDEIQCGMGRTGKLWAHSHLPPTAHPDIVTTAKALGNGFPIGATIVTADVAAKISVGDHGTTFGGNPLASRLGHYVLGRLSDPKLLAGVEAKSALFRDQLQALQKRFPDLITEVRGKGLILGVQLTRDPARILQEARHRGLLIITAGINTLRITPSLTIEDSEIVRAMEILGDAIVASV